VVLGLHVLKESDDIGMSEFFEHSSLIQNLLLARLVHTLDGHKLQSSLATCLEDDRVLASCLFLVDVILVHLNYNNIEADKEITSRKVVEGEAHYVDMAQPDAVAISRVKKVVGLCWQLHPYSLSRVAVFETPRAIS
jgi:hypothetical protein